MRVAVVAVIVSMLGCRKSAPPDSNEPNRPAPSAHVPRPPAGLMVPCRGELCPSGRTLSMTTEGVLTVTPRDCDGCTIEIGGLSLVVEHNKALSFDVVNAIGDASAKGLEKWQHLEIPVKITPPDGEAPEPSMLGLAGSVPAAIVFNRVAKGPLTFKRDTPVPAAHAAIVVRADARNGVVMHLGSAKRVRDFDVVGIAVATEQDAGLCDGRHVTGVSLEVTMYERRTGKSLGKKTFAPEKPDCFRVASGLDLMAMPPEVDMANWVEEFLD